MAIEAPTVEAAYADATAAVRELLAGEREVAGREERPVAVSGSDPAETLLAFLRELLFHFERDTFLPAEVRLDRADATAVEGLIRGERFDPRRHEAPPEIKAVTRHGLTFEETGDGWRAAVLFDV